VGFNTVAFLLNDYSHELEKSPKSVIWALGHPPLSGVEDDLNMKRREVATFAWAINEPIPHPQMIEVLPTFHADFTQYYKAGGNCIDKLEVVKFHKIKGKKCVVLQLPDYMQ